jgi:hypothetical protein
VPELREEIMSRDDRWVLALAGLGLIAGGHKLMNAEVGKLGAPHAVGGVLLAIALRA